MLALLVSVGCERAAQAILGRLRGKYGEGAAKAGAAALVIAARYVRLAPYTSGCQNSKCGA